jgi:hypothetical protein
MNEEPQLRTTLEFRRADNDAGGSTPSQIR